METPPEPRLVPARTDAQWRRLWAWLLLPIDEDRAERVEGNQAGPQEDTEVEKKDQGE